MPNNKDDIKDLLDELKDTKKFGSMIPVEAPKPTEEPDINNENINDWIMKKAGLVIQQGVDTLERIKDSVRNGGESEEIDAYSKLMNAVSSAVDTLNKINIQNKRQKSAKELKKMDIDMKNGQLNGPTNITNNVIIATREEMMVKLFSDAEEQVIDAVVTEDELVDTDMDMLQEEFVDENDMPEEIKKDFK